MSWEAVQWANKQRLKLPQEQLLLLLIANAADPDGTAFRWWKKREHWWTYLVDHSRQSRASVFRHLNTLEGLGLAARTEVISADGAKRYEIELRMNKFIDMGAIDDAETQSHGETQGRASLTCETEPVSPVRPSQSQSCDSIKSRSKIPKEADDDGDARARQTGDIALVIASEVGVICGFATAMDWPPGWQQAHYRVLTWLNAGWEREAILAGCRDAMARKRDGPPSTINYFDKPIATWIARQKQPLPEVKIQERETINVVRKTDNPARDEFREALGELKDFNRGARARSGGGGAPLQLLPPDRDR